MNQRNHYKIQNYLFCLGFIACVVSKLSMYRLIFYINILSQIRVIDLLIKDNKIIINKKSVLLFKGFLYIQ